LLRGAVLPPAQQDRARRHARDARENRPCSDGSSLLSGN
jgi:hypothetical protein